MKDFDAIRVQRETQERKFRILGQEFTLRTYISADDVVALQEAANDSEFLSIVDEIVPKRFLEPGQEAKWKLVRSDPEKPLALYEIVDIVNYAQERVTGRPTDPSSDSSPSSGTNGTASTAPSLSEVSS